MCGEHVDAGGEGYAAHGKHPLPNAWRECNTSKGVNACPGVCVCVCLRALTFLHACVCVCVTKCITSETAASGVLVRHAVHRCHKRHAVEELGMRHETSLPSTGLRHPPSFLELFAQGLSPFSGSTGQTLLVSNSSGICSEQTKPLKSKIRHAAASPRQPRAMVEQRQRMTGNAGFSTLVPNARGQCWVMSPHFLFPGCLGHK